MHKKFLIIVGFVVVAAAIIAACGTTTATPTAASTQAPTQIVSPTPDVPFVSEWQNSGHADVSAEPFNHWNSDGAVPTACARCHTPAGYVEYVSTGKVANDIKAPAGVITCTTCHNSATMNLTSVTFPSGVTINNLGPEARCMECHQGRESTVSVNKTIASFKATDAPDAVPAAIKGTNGQDQTLGFINVHYLAAGATLYGGETHGGYEYPGKTYSAKNQHVEGMDTCIACHDQHSTQVRINKCQQCHDVKTVDDLKNIRMNSSLMDYNGNGDTKEGIYYEIQGLQTSLMTAAQAYAKDVTGTSIVYDGNTYPYFFVDANDDGKADQQNGKPVAFTKWTPRLVEATYNYQFVEKDPGAFAHNPSYVIELLYDSTADLDSYFSDAGKTVPVDMSKMVRDNAAHFAGDTLPFRHWDGADTPGIGTVPGTCAKCHTATGLPQFLAEGTTISNPASDGLACSTCHDTANFPNRRQVTSVTFPSGKTVSFAKDAQGNLAADDSNLCIECHQGRESTVSVNKSVATAGATDDEVSAKLSFIDVHHLPAGATFFGNDVEGAYQYPGKTYVGANSQHPLNKCTDCHDAHTLAPKVEACAGCHGTDKPEDIRAPGDTTDYDGDGNTTEGMKGEIDTLEQALYAQMQTYAETTAGTPIVYSTSYPNFFVDANKDGKPDSNDKGLVSYNAWTPRLLKAAYNYQLVQEDPGAFVHNPKYVIEFLIDSIQDLGGDVSHYVRP